MEDRIEFKQPLPFPFYDSLEKQNKYKAQCEGYAHNEYIITYGCFIPPFQIKRTGNSFVVGDIVLTLVNVTSNTEENITAHISSQDWDISTLATGYYDFITYYGVSRVLNGAECIFTEGCIYYLKLNDGGDYYYSEEFKYFGTIEEETNYIKYNPSNAIKHDVGITDLLIHKA